MYILSFVQVSLVNLYGIAKIHVYTASQISNTPLFKFEYLKMVSDINVKFKHFFIN